MTEFRNNFTTLTLTFPTRTIALLREKLRSALQSRAHFDMLNVTRWALNCSIFLRAFFSLCAASPTKKSGPAYMQGR